MNVSFFTMSLRYKDATKHGNVRDSVPQEA